MASESRRTRPPPPKSIKDVKTDAFVLGVGARKHAAVKAVATVRYDQLHTLKRTYELPTEPNQGFLTAHAERTPLTSSDPVFRISHVGQPLMGKYTSPNRNVRSPTPLYPWRDLDQTEP